jgi:hypothetical protein
VSDDPLIPDDEEVTADLAAAKERIEEAQSDMAREREGREGETPEEPTPVGPTNEEAQAAYEANPTIQIGGGPDSDVG